MKALDDNFTLRTEHGVITVRITIAPLDAPARSAIDPRKAIKKGFKLSITGSYPGGGGQCIDELRSVGRGMPAMLQLADTWDRWHLNGMHAGTVKQQEALKGATLDRLNYYESATKHLESVGLLNDRGCKYGSAWLFEPLPESILEVWAAAKAAAEAVAAERAAMLARAAEASEDEDAADDTDTRTPAEIIGEERDIDPELLTALAEHLGIGLDEAADYHEEHHRGNWRSIAEYAEELASDIGAVNRDAKWPNNHIDWEAAGEELLQSDVFMLDSGDVYINA